MKISQFCLGIAASSVLVAGDLQSRDSDAPPDRLEVPISVDSNRKYSVHVNMVRLIIMRYLVSSQLLSSLQGLILKTSHLHSVLEPDTLLSQERRAMTVPVLRRSFLSILNDKLEKISCTFL